MLRYSASLISAQITSLSSFAASASFDGHSSLACFPRQRRWHFWRRHLIDVAEHHSFSLLLPLYTLFTMDLKDELG